MKGSCAVCGKYGVLCITHGSDKMCSKPCEMVLQNIYQEGHTLASWLHQKVTCSHCKKEVDNQDTLVLFSYVAKSPVRVCSACQKATRQFVVTKGNILLIEGRNFGSMVMVNLEGRKHFCDTLLSPDAVMQLEDKAETRLILESLIYKQPELDARAQNQIVLINHAQALLEEEKRKQAEREKELEDRRREEEKTGKKRVFKVSPRR